MERPLDRIDGGKPSASQFGALCSVGRMRRENIQRSPLGIGADKVRRQAPEVALDLGIFLQP